jgi:hypothetical protein
MKNFSKAICISGLLLSSCQLLANTTQFYVGLSDGHEDEMIKNSQQKIFHNAGQVLTLNLGVKFNPYFAEEIYYTTSGNYNLRKYIAPKEHAQANGVSGDAGTYVAGFNVKVIAPIKPYIHLYTKLGYAYLNSAYAALQGNNTLHKSGIGYSLGAQFSLNQLFSEKVLKVSGESPLWLDIDIRRINGAGDGERRILNIYSLGLTWNFG